jgi:hypothetical protein
MFLSEADISATPLAQPSTEYIRAICIGSLTQMEEETGWMPAVMA